MLAQVAREADQFAGQFEREAQPLVGRVETDLAHLALVDAVRRPAPGLGGERGDRVLAEAQRLADLADGASRAVMDDRGGEAGAFAAVFGVDVLDDLLAALVLEIDVDVGRFLAFGGDEALEQDLHVGRVDGGDAKHEADRRVGGRAAALAQDALGAGEADDVLHREEVGGIVELVDERQFMVDQAAHLVRTAVRIALRDAALDQVLQFLLGAAAVPGDLVGIFVGQFVEIEGRALDDLDGACKGRFVALEQAGHGGGGLEVALGVLLHPQAGLVDGAFLADAGHHVGQCPAAGGVHEGVVDGDERGVMALCEAGQRVDAFAVVPEIEVLGGEIDVARTFRRPAVEACGKSFVRHVRGQQHQGEALRMVEDIVPGDQAFALGDGAAAARDQPRETAIGGPVGGEGEQALAAVEVEPGADHDAKAEFLRLGMSAHHAGQRIAVGDGDGGVLEQRRLGDEFFRQGGAFEKREGCAHMKLGIGAHGNTPWRYQRVCPASAACGVR